VSRWECREEVVERMNKMNKISIAPPHTEPGRMESFSSSSSSSSSPVQMPLRTLRPLRDKEFEKNTLSILSKEEILVFFTVRLIRMHSCLSVCIRGSKFRLIQSAEIGEIRGLPLKNQSQDFKFSKFSAPFLKCPKLKKTPCIINY